MTPDNSISNQITVAICSYNGAEYLPNLLLKLVSQQCSIPFEILIVDNNSTDNTQAVIQMYSESSVIPIRHVIETQQGIAFARNRAIEECLSSHYLAFIDADEIPEENWLQAAVKTLADEVIDCVGGRISIDLPYRPAWLSDDLLPFYGKVDHSNQAFRIIDRSTPIWSGNIAYNTRIFQQGVRFDTRYNRKGKGLGGGEDGILFRYLLQHGFTLVYEPEMEIVHLIPDEKIKRGYFLQLHYLAGKKTGLYEMNFDGKKIFGIPGFMFVQLFKKTYQVLHLRFVKPYAYMREAMNLTYQLGLMCGFYKKIP